VENAWDPHSIVHLPHEFQVHASPSSNFNDVLFTVEVEIVDEWVALENRGLHFTRDKAHRSLEGYS